MDTNRIKKFATEARNILKQGVADKMLSLGFDRSGHVEDGDKPVLIQGGSIFRGQPKTENFYRQWMSLYKRIAEKGVREVYEEAAYTWFNRLVAIRILVKNGITAPVLDFVDSARTPRIVDSARMGRFPDMPAQDMAALRELLMDDNRITEQFAILITAYCHNEPIIFKCFGAIADYTELLLPNNILEENGFLDMLNHTDFITDENFRSPELIGWLYQFYIAERKDEVFGKSGKWDADEIAPATQIFTPNWIVKYMVQNTVGRIYLDNNPWASNLKEKWQYLVEPSEETPDECKLKYRDLSELKVADLACGSGHILNECFDLLYDLYIEDGEGRSDAIRSIFKNNLTGIDLDTRAKQLATFALLLKACQKDVSFADAKCMPNILCMPEPIEGGEYFTGHLHHFFKGTESRQDVKAITEAFELMKDADSLGSIMIFDIPDSTRRLIEQTVKYYDELPYHEDVFDNIMPAMRLILALTQKYHALAMNPPYMGSSHMDDVLLNYIKNNYPEGKSDLCTTFMILQSNRSCDNGLFAFIIPPSWMFLSGFESLRLKLINNYTFNSLLHMSRGVFGADFGSSSCVLRKNRNINAAGVYFRLIERTFQEFDQKHLKELFEKCLLDHDFRFKFSEYDKNIHSIEYSENGAKIYYDNIKQKNFKELPSTSLGYWASEKLISILSSKNNVESIAPVRQGFQTGNNDKYLRVWHEVNFSNIGFSCKNTEDFHSEKNNKYAPYNKGGAFRKWFGNNTFIVKFDKEAYNCLLHEGNCLPSRNLYFKDSITYSSLSSGLELGARSCGQGFTFSAKGPCLFPKNDAVKHFLLGLLNSKVVSNILTVLAPTMDFNVGTIRNIPIVESNNVNKYVDDNLIVAKKDWDAHETSWDFERNELLSIDTDVYMDNINYLCEKHFKETGEHICIDPAPPMPESLEWRLDQYKLKWEKMFFQLHENEEELNRQFIEIYGLQDELTPDVPLKDITILQNGEISIENDELIWNDGAIIKQLISYAVGCWMGRYRLDKPGLHIAHPNPTEEELSAYEYNGKQFVIDDDGIIPILSSDCAFDDNLKQRVENFIRIAFGAEYVNQNISFVEACLGTTIEKYLMKDFWKDHKKMYQNRPIYWLFSSKKGAFQCLVYMHRMDANTADRVRCNYLMTHIDWLRQTITGYEADAASLSTSERRRLEQLRKDLIECEEYNDRLQQVANQQIAFDLDDGVVVNYAKFGDVLAKIR